jgi:FHA domain
VLKHCPEGHTMEMAWRTCPQCTGEPPLMQPEAREFSDATRIIEPAVVAQALAAPEPGLPLAWALVVTEGILLGRRIELQGKGVRVGRAPKLAGGQEPVELPDLHLSRDHFAVVPDGDGWAVHDLGSTNGTKVNGEKVNRRPVQPGDEVRAGHTTFVVEAGSADGA